MKKLTFLLTLVFATPTLALHDYAAIDIKPLNEQTSFCVEYDTPMQFWDAGTLYSANNFYIAAMTPLGDILFVEPTEDSPMPTITPWLPGSEAPIFSPWRIGPICLGPFPNAALDGLHIFAGVGNDVDDVLTRQNYINIFAGFPELPAPKKEWTVMVYMVGSDLEAKLSRKGGRHWASIDIAEMLEGTRALPNDNSNLVVSTGGSTRVGWNTVKRTLIQQGQAHVLEDLGSKNMAEPQTLSDFVIWAKSQFPAEHYALILWNHGGGTQGYGKDTSDGGQGAMMNLGQLHQAFQTVSDQSDTPLDIVIYDACLMASIEVAEITSTAANAMASSVELEPGHGIDYAHLMSQLAESPPEAGIDFGRLVKTGYIEHTKKEGTFDTSQITYSVLDLTQLPLFTETFSEFAAEFKKLLKQQVFLDYERLSRGIIRAPGYPLMETGRLRSLRSINDNHHVRIDLYNILQTVAPGFDEFSESATQLVNILDQMVVDYETNDNVKAIQADAGRLSIDINLTNTDHLAALPEAYTLLNEGLVYYDKRRQSDGTQPNGKKDCFKGRGLICAFAQWLRLDADDILGIEAYFGQKPDDVATVYVIDPTFYQYQELSEELKISADGHQACQYQLCINETDCEDITLTKQRHQLLADVSLNDSPAILSFCQTDDDSWSVCGVVQQVDGIWGRDDYLYTDDRIIPNTWHVEAGKTEQRERNALIVENPEQVTLEKSCDIEKAAIWVMYYGLNQQAQTTLLCDSGDCVCQEDKNDDGCEEIGFNAGVILEQ